MKSVIDYIWQNRLFCKEGLETTTGESLYIIESGTADKEKENIYTNAKIRIGEKLWCGNIVLHCKSSNWEEELHSRQKSYSNVILHVTLNNDCETLRPHGETINQLTIKCPPGLEEEFCQAEQHCSSLPCGKAISRLPNIHFHSCLSRILAERIEEKASLVEKRLISCNGKWEDTLFKTLIRSFGFGTQNQVFEQWAAVLDMQALARHRDNPLQTDAIFFGQAGLLDEESIPYYYRDNARNCSYYNRLAEEYKFLASKFGLKSIDHNLWGGGNTTPHCRIARLAAIYRSGLFTISQITSCNTLSEYRKCIEPQTSEYWQKHSCFGSTEKLYSTPVKEKQKDVLIINSIVPILYVYGKHSKNYKFCSKAEDILHQMKSEENHIVRQWREKGVCIECAADSQALIQLSKSYCQKHNCVNCKFAYHYIKSRITEC